HVLNLKDYALTDSRYEDSIIAQCEVEESGTGVIMTGSSSSPITTNMVTISFEDSPTVFKPGLAYEGKIKVINPKSKPIGKKVIYLTVSYANNKHSVHKLVTNNKGIAQFSLNTEPWGPVAVTLEAKYEQTRRPRVYGGKHLVPYYPTAYLSLQPFYSKSQSFIKLMSSLMPFSCKKNAVIRAQYMIHQSALRPRQKTLTFYYMVMNKGHLVQQGHILETIHPGKEHRGKLVVTLKKMLKMTPVAQVVLYTVLPSDEVVADSKNYPIQLCLANKVSLKFSHPTEVPGSKTSLQLKAAPGSLCSVRAIDQRLLLLQPDNELNIQSVFNMLPVQLLSGYPYRVIERDSKHCWGIPPIRNIRLAALAQVPSAYFPNSGKVDVYNTFKDVGIKILTNVNIRKPCINGLWLSAPERMVEDFETKESISIASSSNQPVATIHKYFP
ncbi:hypothetical protein AMELA_G00284880, partial [Ameiurus melas]